jgi:hypothetical protein
MVENMPHLVVQNGQFAVLLVTQADDALLLFVEFGIGGKKGVEMGQKRVARITVIVLNVRCHGYHGFFLVEQGVDGHGGSVWDERLVVFVKKDDFQFFSSAQHRRT